MVGCPEDVNERDAMASGKSSIANQKEIKLDKVYFFNLIIYADV